jgi:hypothetical protein
VIHFSPSSQMACSTRGMISLFIFIPQYLMCPCLTTCVWQSVAHSYVSGYLCMLFPLPKVLVPNFIWQWPILS